MADRLWRTATRVWAEHGDTLERAFVLAALLWIGMRTWGLFDQFWSFTTDDAYITLRYARNLAAGHGATWNPGEPPVEGFSNFTFVALGAAALKLGFDPIYTLKIAGADGILATIPLLYWIARRWVRPALALMAPIVFTAHVGATWWGISGLETGVHVAGTLLAFALVLLALGYRAVGAAEHANRRPPHPAWAALAYLLAGVVLAILGMTRPESPVIAVLLVATVAAHGWLDVRVADAPRDRARLIQRARRSVMWLALSFGVLWGLYFVARAFYFERLLPNTIYCKQGYDEEPYLLLWRYWNYSGVFALLALTIPWRKLDARHVFVFGLPLAYLGILQGVDPIIGYFDRLFLAAHAVVVLGTVAALPHLLDRVLGPHAPRLRAIALGLLVMRFHGELEAPVVKANEEYLLGYDERMTNREDLGMWLDARLRADQTFVIGDAGLVPYLAHARVLDAFCLNSRETTGEFIDRDPARWVEWMFAQAPEKLVVHSRYRSRLEPREEYGVFPLLVTHPDFTLWYEREEVFKDTRFTYYVYGRTEDAPGAREFDPSWVEYMEEFAVDPDDPDGDGEPNDAPG